MRKTRIQMASLILVAFCFTAPLGCFTPSPGPSNGEPPETGLVVVPLGDNGEFGGGLSDGVGHMDAFQFEDQLPEAEPIGASVLFDAADITVSPPAGSAVVPDATITLLVQIAEVTELDPCGALVQLLFFDIKVTDGVATSVTPSATTLDGAGFQAVRSGAMSLCIIATATEELQITVDSVRIDFIMEDEVSAHSCEDILDLPEVKAALDELDSNGVDFSLPTGSGAPHIEGDYELESEITFDPDNENVGDTQTVDVTLRDQTISTITRSGLNASISQFIRGEGDSVGLCTLQRTGLTACDQTIARLESLSFDSATGNLEGEFLSVAVRRHDFTSESCGAAGDFIYGSLSLTYQGGSTRLVESLGKVELPDEFEPGLIVLPPDGGNGTVTDIGTDTALHFATVDPFTTTAIPLPDDLDATGFSALGMSADGDRLALVTNNPDAAFVFANDDLAAIRDTSTTTRDFQGEFVPFSLDNALLYVPTTDDSLLDHITVLRANDSSFADEVRRITTPQGAIPVQARLRPDGRQLAVLLEGGAPIGEAAALAFVNLDSNQFTQPVIDLSNDAGGTVLAAELVYSADGGTVFLAGLGAVVAVETASPHEITRIDVSEGASDNPVSLALSGDGEVLAVAIDDSNGSVDFAVVDTSTLKVVNAQDLPGVGDGRALGVAHFATARVAMVANLESTVVAVRTEPPYTAGEPILVADVTNRNTIGRIVSGGGVIAVTNVDEPAIYLFKLTE